jgi:hypothetical protein
VTAGIAGIEKHGSPRLQKTWNISQGSKAFP